MTHALLDLVHYLACNPDCHKHLCAIPKEIIVALGLRLSDTEWTPLQEILDSVPLQSAPEPFQPTRLSNREWQTLQLVARGYTDAQVAAELGICTGTVENHMTNIRSKRGVGSRSAAVAWAWETRLLK
jgi:DNA-binding NarL/FixJ family response regulator